MDGKIIYSKSDNNPESLFLFSKNNVFLKPNKEFSILNNDTQNVIPRLNSTNVKSIVTQQLGSSELNKNSLYKVNLLRKPKELVISKKPQPQISLLQKNLFKNKIVSAAEPRKPPNENQRNLNRRIEIIEEIIFKSTPQINRPEIVNNPKKVFFCKDGSLKPIISPNIKSGIFRSTTKEDKSTNSTDQHNNVVSVAEGKQGRIIPIEEYHNDLFVPQASASNPMSAENIFNYITQKVRAPSYEDQINYVSYLNKTGNVQMQSDKKTIICHNNANKLVYHIVTPEDFRLQSKLATVGQKLDEDRKIKNLKKLKSKQTKEKQQQQLLETINNKRPTAITRYGRVTRPPNSLNNNFGFVQITDDDVPDEEDKMVDDQMDMITTMAGSGGGNCVPGFKHNRQTNKLYKKAQSKNNENWFHNHRNEIKFGREKCTTCNKLYIGRKKVLSHLKAFPDHIFEMPPLIDSAVSAANPQQPYTSMPALNTASLENDFQSKTITSCSTPLPTQPYLTDLHLFDYLCEKIRQFPANEKAHQFLKEISDFVEKLESIKTRLLCANEQTPVEYMDKYVCKIFGTQAGNYHINMNILESDDQQRKMHDDHLLFPSNIYTDDHHNIITNDSHNLSTENRLEYNLNMSLDSISDSKMNLVADEESLLLRSVDELVAKRLKNHHLPINDDEQADEVELLLGHNNVRVGNGNGVVNNFDHINDNAVEAMVTMKNLVSDNDNKEAISTATPILDLSLDLFQFHSN